LSAGLDAMDEGSVREGWRRWEENRGRKRNRGEKRR
jgi:hypothetical protein